MPAAPDKVTHGTNSCGGAAGCLVTRLRLRQRRPQRARGGVAQRRGIVQRQSIQRPVVLRDHPLCNRAGRRTQRGRHRRGERPLFHHRQTPAGNARRELHRHINDGHGGGNRITGNAIWNTVRETGDHGCINSWDRQPYWTRANVDDGFNDPAGRSLIKARDVQSRNLLINGYNGVWPVDHDDGSQFMDDVDNVLVWGGCKNYLGNSKVCDRNLIVYPGIDARSSGNRLCQTDDNGKFANQFHRNNTCVTSLGQYYSFSNCNGGNVNVTAYHTSGNTLAFDGHSFSACGVNSLPAWQAAGQDAGSVLAPAFSVAEIVTAAKAVLGM